jgi:RimJ/RimL family protein N-acetyltransferase
VTAAPRETIPDLSALEVELTTPRLQLRPLADDDVEPLWPHVSNPEVPRLMMWSAHTERRETRAFITAMAAGRVLGTNLAWAIVHDGDAAGVIGLHQISWALGACRRDHAELGFWLAPPLHGRGLMTEAGAAVLAFAFGPLGLHKVTTGHLVDNHASRRVIEKLGFRLVGRAEDDLHRDGRWHTALRYERLTDR